jgi:LPXTG-motif cell wall-anchored protein
MLADFSIAPILDVDLAMGERQISDGAIIFLGILGGLALIIIFFFRRKKKKKQKNENESV